MDDTLLKESFLYGNLRVAFTTRQIKHIPLHKFNSWIGDEPSIESIWRYYFNFRTLFKDREVDIFNDIEKYKSLINLFKNYTSYIEEFYEIRDKFINLEPETPADHFKLTVYALLIDIQMIIKSYEIKVLSEMYNNLFSSYLPFIKNQTIICYFKPVPQGDTIWKPAWKFIYGNKEIQLKDIDCYIDSFFINEHFHYNYGMINTIDCIRKRILFLKERAPVYMKEIISPKLEKVTRNIFETFPYSLIYQKYPQLMKVDQDVYQPTLYKEIRVDSDMGWILSILPLDLTSFLIGYPVISCGTPSASNIKEKVKEITEKGFDYYLRSVRNNNKNLIESYAFGVPIKNGIDDDGDFCDHLFEKVIDYNIDDTLIFFNTGVIHIFTSSEFEGLLKKKISSYNRNKITKLRKVKVNEDYKKETRRNMAKRGLDLSLRGTMKFNLEEIEEEMKNEEIREIQVRQHSYDVPERSMFNIILGLE